MKILKSLYLLVLVSVTMFAQTVYVRGNVSTLTDSVKNALITFTYENDTTKSFTTLTDSLGNYNIGLVTSIEDDATSVPTKFELGQNYPNPFSDETAVTYKLNEQSDVRVTIYDILGREVKKYNIGEQPAGIHGILWNGRNNFGEKVTTGIYFYRLNAGKESLVNKMVFTRGVGISGSLSLGGSFIPSAGLSKTAMISSSLESYKVKIENTENTEPRIAAKELEDITIEKDTTINFSVNKLPVANAGEDREVKVGQYVILDAAQSEVGDGSELFYHWEADTTNPVEVFVIFFQPQVIPGFTQEGTYKFSLVVNDGIADSEPDEVVIEVGPREESKFEDPVMELYVRLELEDPAGELTDEKLASLNTLTSQGIFGEVTSLEGIEKCSNLTQLTFGLNNITDLTPLTGLTKLENLALDQNYILADISPLANLINLTELNLLSNNISDISALKNLTKINMLNLIGNPIMDMSPLENMKDITDLSFGQWDRNSVPVSGLSVIEGLTKLEMLWITSSEITNISFVNTLTNLIYLHLRNNKIIDIQGVSNCIQLARLYLDLNEITDITPLERLTNINLLDLKYNQITNIEPLVNNSGLGQGDAVSLTGNPLDGISINQYIPELQSRGVTVFY